MHLERVRPAVLRATLHAHELAALMAAVRTLVAGAPQEVPEEARRRLEELLADYDEQVRRLQEEPGPGSGGLHAPPQRGPES